MIKIPAMHVLVSLVIAMTGCQSQSSNNNSLAKSSDSIQKHAINNFRNTAASEHKVSLDNRVYNYSYQASGSGSRAKLDSSKQPVRYHQTNKQQSSNLQPSKQQPSNHQISNHQISNLQINNQTSSLLSAPVIKQYESLNALNMAKQNPDLSIMVEAIEAAGVSGMIRFAGNSYTILAPNNEAFYKLFKETTLTKETLLANKSLLRFLLSYHVIKTKLPLSTEQMQPSILVSLNKKKLTIDQQRNIIDERGRLAQIIIPNIATKNGNVHIIDRVLFPKG